MPDRGASVSRLPGGCNLVSQAEQRIEVRTREGQQWLTQIGNAGQTVRVHGREFAVDVIYR